MFTKRGNLATPKIVPFDGGGELATQLVAGAVDVGVLNLAEAGAQIEAGMSAQSLFLLMRECQQFPMFLLQKNWGSLLVFLLSEDLSFTRMSQMTWLRKLRTNDQSHETWSLSGFPNLCGLIQLL